MSLNAQSKSNDTHMILYTRLKRPDGANALVSVSKLHQRLYSDPLLNYNGSMTIIVNHTCINRTFNSRKAFLYSTLNMHLICRLFAVIFCFLKKHRVTNIIDNKYEIYLLSNSKLDEKINQEVDICKILLVWFTNYVFEGQIQNQKIRKYDIRRKKPK